MSSIEQLSKMVELRTLSGNYYRFSYENGEWVVRYADCIWPERVVSFKSLTGIPYLQVILCSGIVLRIQQILNPDSIQHLIV